jgi:hypothetical protein
VPSRKPEPLLRVSCFEILIGDQEFGFADVGPLSSETPVDANPDRPGHRFAAVVLRRALTSATDLYDWRRRIVDGKDDRRDVTIRQLSAPAGKVVNTWRLVAAWPRRWSGPDFHAMSQDIAYEEIELAFDDLVWLERNSTITRG